MGRASRTTDGAIRQRRQETTADPSVLKARRAMVRARLRLGTRSGPIASSVTTVLISFGDIPDHSGASPHQRSFEFLAPKLITDLLITKNAPSPSVI